MFCSPISEFRHFVTLLLLYSTIRYGSSFRKRFDNSSQKTTHLFVILKLLENTVLYRTMNLIKSKAEICLDQFLRYGSRRVSLIYLIKLHYSTFRYGLPKMPDITIFHVVSWFRYFVTVCSFIRHFITVFSKPLK